MPVNAAIIGSGSESQIPDGRIEPQQMRVMIFDAG
jgi:hypothetical protein